jgi:hypothetical protein
MTTRTLIRSAATAALALAATGAAMAEPTAFIGSAIDPNTFIVGHPASPRWKVAHANHEHPAVVQARLALQGAAIDPNTFIVQPPASTRWLARGDSQPQAKPVLAQAQ